MQSINPSLLVAATLAMTPVMSSANPLDDHSVAVKVSRADLDLSAPAGVEKLFTRLTIAATQACGIEAKFDPLRAALFDRCYHNALNRAIRAVNNPLLTQAYVEHYPQVAVRYQGADGRWVAAK